MSVRSKNPGGGGGSPIQSWVYLSVPNGGSAVAFMAGRPFGVYCHAVGKRSKPCRLLTTDGALSCAYCCKEKPVWRGYVPLYSREYVRSFVVISEDYNEAVCEIPRFEQVKLFRAKVVTAPVVIRAENWRTTPLPPSQTREAEPDMLPCLLRLWKDEELAAWHRKSDIPVSQQPCPTAPPAPSVPVADELGLMKELVRSRINWPGKDGAAEQPAALGDVLNAVPAANGRHRKPK